MNENIVFNNFIFSNNFVVVWPIVIYIYTKQQQQQKLLN